VTGSELFALSEGGLRWTGIRPRSADRLEAGALVWERAPIREGSRLD
jgi:hypothetical protein